MNSPSFTSPHPPTNLYQAIGLRLVFDSWQNWRATLTRDDEFIASRMDDLEDILKQLFGIIDEIATTAKVQEDGTLRPAYWTWLKSGGRVNVKVRSVMCCLRHIANLRMRSEGRARQPVRGRVEVRQNVLW